MLPWSAYQRGRPAIGTSYGKACVSFTSGYDIREFMEPQSGGSGKDSRGVRYASLLFNSRTRPHHNYLKLGEWLSDDAVLMYMSKNVEQTKAQCFVAA